MTNKKGTLLNSLKKTLVFYATKARKHIPANRKKALALAKEELRILFGEN